MRKLLIMLSSIMLTTTTGLYVVACGQNQSLENKLDNIIGFREIGIGYKYKDLWKNLMVENSEKMGEFNNAVLWEISSYSQKWFNETRKDLDADTNPRKLKELSDTKFGDRIFLDFEFPYSTNETAQFFGANVVTSTLHDVNFFQIYNYQYLVDMGFKISAAIVNTNNHEPVIEILNSNPDEDGAIYIKGKDNEGNETIAIKATKTDENGNEITLETELAVQNASNQSNAFIQWKTYQYIKNRYGFMDNFQELVATFLVQIHAQMMYNYSYNLTPGLKNKVALLDENMLDMLYCAAVYGQYINYMQYWPAGNIPISGFGLYYSFDFYVHPSYQIPGSEIKELNSNPVIELSDQLWSYAKEILALYEKLESEGK